MRKITIVILTIVMVVCLNGCSYFKNKNNLDNKEAVTNEEKRTVTIVNKTDEVINEFHFYEGEGTELKEYERENIDEESFSFVLDKDYKKHNKFSVVLVDCYGLHYGKENVVIEKEGNTEIVITKEDYLEKKGDFWKKWDRLLNE